MNLSALEVWQNIVAAADTMRRLHVTIGPAGFKSSWPDIVQAAAESYGYQHLSDLGDRDAPPDSFLIDQADEVMGWLDWLDKRDQRLVWSRANGAAWWLLTGRFGKSEKTLKRWLDTSVMLIANRLAEKNIKIA